MKRLQHYFYHILAGVAVVIQLTACNKYLDVNPDMRTDLDTPEKVGELLATAYPQANYITFTEAMTDNVGDKGSGDVQLINSSPYYFKDVADQYQDSPEYYWNASYNAIAAANQALEAISQASDQKAYEGFKGEALVARAYAHFMLVSLYAKIYDARTADTDPGIPYVTTPETVVIKKYERGTVASVYEQIDKDLTEGLPLIDDSKYVSPKYHFTRAAAHAFASRFYLFKKDYAKVVEHANAVFGSGSIRSYLRPVNSEAYRSYQYNELQAQYTRADNKANILLVEAPSLWGRSFPTYRYGFTFDNYFSTIGAANVTGGSWAYGVYGQDVSLNIPKFREHFVRETLNAETGIPYNMIPLFSAEDVLFNRAEANAMLGNVDETLDDLNDYAATHIVADPNNDPVYYPDLHDISLQKVIAFYGLADRQQDLIQCILDFKRINFLFEGQRWFDILRYNLPVTHNTADRQTLVLGPTDLQRVFQIPEAAQSSGIQLNPR